MVDVQEDFRNSMYYLEEDDVKCGTVYFNEKSRVLKYVCFYCEQCSDNIDHFCNHLTEHINDEDPIEYTGIDEDMGEIENDLSNESTSEETNAAHPYYNEEQEIHSAHINEVPINDQESLTSTSTTIIEELNSSFENHNENETTEQYYQPVTLPNSSINATSKSFEDCFLKETNIEKIRSQGIVVQEKGPTDQQKRKIDSLFCLGRNKRTKITTVKVIAVKNRIAEIYDRIKNQQEKYRSGYFVESCESDPSTIETMEDNEEISTFSGNNQKLKATQGETSSKIIGETLITLIPEGGRIPPVLPNKDDECQSKIQIANTDEFDESLLSSSSDNEQKAVCPACGKIFRNHFSLTIHKRTHYLESDSSVKLAHKCSDCNQLFNKLSQLKQHIESVHYPDGFICKICNRRLCSLSLLLSHLVKVHLDRPFNCQMCGKNFSNPVTYEEHVISHNSSEKSHKCQICGRKYSTQFFLKEHIKNHKEQLPQTCVVCGKVTLRITQHMKTHTPRPKRLLSCSVCGKVFNYSSGLSHHFKAMHKMPRASPKVKKESKRKRKYVDKTEKNEDDFNITDNNFNNSQIVIEEPSEIPDEVYNQDEDVKLENTESDSKDKMVADQDDVNYKEEEAKRVIVELIQNSSYSSFLSENLFTPPIAREETITAVNSIVHDS
ncbi:uncharacterized protein LOC142232163 [Haematobia irritans]|uniref:uncharacterized protein LOC142232163 n=1 Tax=Haematobia irritans TaxID=7368 RepID=UPI003F4F9273